jgi:dienelactone hydrolase
MASQELPAEPLEGTDELTWQGDLAALLVDRADAFLLSELEKSIERRASHWQRDVSSPESYGRSIEPQRERLRHLIGLRDARNADTTPTIRASATLVQAAMKSGDGTSTKSEPTLPDTRYASSQAFDVYAIQWLAFGDVFGVGLLLEPKTVVHAQFVAIPDCEVTPEQLIGLTPGVPLAAQYARRLAEAGCRVVVPVLVNRQRGQFDWGARPAPDVTNREMIYRSAYELGRGMIGYEVQQILAVVDWFERSSDKPIGVVGWGEGGLLALYSGAVDTRIERVGVSGYFDSRQRLWSEPIDRNVFALLEQFGDAELATMIAPRKLIIEASSGPVATLPGNGGAPAQLVSPEPARVAQELERARRLLGPLAERDDVQLVTPAEPNSGPGTEPTMLALLESLVPEERLTLQAVDTPRLIPGQMLIDAGARHRTLMQQLDRHSQQVLQASGDVRREFVSKLDTSSIAAYEASVESYRTFFADEVIGRFADQPLPPRPRTRQVYETDTWRGYEVVLDLFGDLFAYGLLLVPKDLEEGERRPVVVCQHGLEGRPQDTVGVQGAGPYQGFAGKLAERGFIVFSPQNLYIGEDRFRTLQRKSYPLKKTLFSIIVPQHQQIVDWLQTLDFVDPERVAFYGLSYGGKTAMRVPPLVTDYCLSICSADFNEWVDKNASTRNPRSYVWTGEYEIFEFDLGSTFNYAEMAALIAPRPFMVERGHDDGVADDWTVAWEFAKVQNLYAAQLKLPTRCRIEWFDGPHTINGQGTFEFLHEWLKWPAKR